MYPLKGGDIYGQQSYPVQQAYGLTSGVGYPGNQNAADVNSQHTLASRQPVLLSSVQEADIGGYRSQTSQAPHYGGAYASVYGSSALSSSQQVSGLSGKGTGSRLQGQQAYSSAYPESSKFGPGAGGGNLGLGSEDYVASSYGHKIDQYPIERRHYDDHRNAYVVRDDLSRRGLDSSAISFRSQPEVRDHADQSTLLRQPQILKVQSLQPGSDLRQADYLAARTAAIHHGHQDISTFGGRMDSDPHNMSLGSAPYAAQHPTSLLGGSSRGNVDHVYAHGSVAGYGVGLPPGRDYAAGKGLHGTSHEAVYQGSVLSQGGFSKIGLPFVDERKDDRSAARRELELREEERRRELLREREKERERELERERDKERERDRERIRERERQKERVRERERERDREREREREHILKRRDKERERKRKRGTDHRLEKTSPRTSKDRQVSSATKADRSLGASPRRETLHRHHSPVKEKRREYICKVSSFSLMDTERDYMSLHKRYPRLSISPAFSKVILGWPKGNMNLSLYTPVSFEHEVVDVDSDQKDSLHLFEKSGKSEGVSTIWNTKVILMSGISSSALEELCNDKSSTDRITHIDNILKFAILKKDHSFMAIGGPWNASVDGGDPSVDDSPLIRAAKRHVKDLTHLDLHNCQNWNKFLEIHYDRVGNDGLFSHKEITIIYLPDLSHCLPALDLWRSQCLVRKKKTTEKCTQKENKPSGKDISQDQTSVTTEKACDDGNAVRVKNKDDLEKHDFDGSTNEYVPNVSKGENTNETVELKENAARISVTDDEQLNKMLLEEENIETTGHIGNVQASVFTSKAKTPAKRKAVKKTVKGKPANKATMEKKADKDVEKMQEQIDKEKQEKKSEDKTVHTDVVHQDELSVDPANVKTFARKKTNKMMTAKVAQIEDKVLEDSDTKNEKNPDKDKLVTEEKNEQAGTSVKVATSKATGKKKVIRRVIKRKIAKVVDKGENVVIKQGEDHGVAIGVEDTNTKDLMVADSPKLVTSMEDKPVTEPKEMDTAKQDVEMKNEIEDENKAKNTVDLKPGNVVEEAVEAEDTKHQDIWKGDGKKEKKKDEKSVDYKPKSRKESKEKNPERPPKFPGFCLRTKQSKDSKFRSMSLSLDGLLDYTDKDIEESTFELSLFAESLGEMLQFEMGHRLLSFLQKLRLKFIAKRSQRKREQSSDDQKNVKDVFSEKCSKLADDDKMQNEDIKSAAQDAPVIEDSVMQLTGMESLPSESDETKKEKRTVGMEEELEEPEELSDYDEEMDNSFADKNAAEKEGTPDNKVEAGAKTEKSPDKEKGMEDAEKNSGQEVSKVDEHDSQQKVNNVTELDAKLRIEKDVDKELLQAFRYFDRNRLGYIKVEDLRLIIHNLGMFLPHGDVKELVRCALLETNSGGSNRIMYHKLARLNVV